MTSVNVGNMVDADRYQAALESPRVRINGRVYAGRVLSIEEWQPWGERIHALEAAIAEGQKAGAPESAAKVAKLAREGLETMAGEYFRTIFPPPPRWAVWRRDPVPLLLAHPAKIAILRGFFGHQVREVKKLAAHLTDGNDSPS